MKLSIILIVTYYLCNITAQTIRKGSCEDCPRYTSAAGCANTCKSLSIYPDGCKFKNWEACESLATARSPCWKHKCVCQCSPLPMCDFKQVTKASPTCVMTKLTKVDAQIAENIVWNVAASMGGNVPVVGGLIDVGMAAWGPVNPLNTAAGLAQETKDEMTKAINELKQCMDDKIIDSRVQAVKDKQIGLQEKFASIKEVSGDDKITRLDRAFTTWNSDLSEIFQKETSYREYEMMLPVYQILHPMYRIIAAERVIAWQNKGDTKNKISAQTGSITRIYKLLNTWINDAKTKIAANLAQKIANAKASGSCQTGLADKALVEWKTNFDKQYITPLYDGFVVIIGANRPGVITAQWNLVPVTKTVWGRTFTLNMKQISTAPNGEVIGITDSNPHIFVEKRNGVIDIANGKIAGGTGFDRVDTPGNGAVSGHLGLLALGGGKLYISYFGWQELPAAPNGKKWKDGSIGNDRTIYAITEDDLIYKFTPSDPLFFNARTWKDPVGKWTWVNGFLNQIDVDQADKIWGVQSRGYLYSYNGAKWTEYGPKTPNGQKWKYVSSSGGVTIAIGVDGIMWYGSNKYGYWQQIEGVSIKQVSVGSDTHIWAVGTNGKLYELNKKTLAPAIPPAAKRRLIEIEMEQV